MQICKIAHQAVSMHFYWQLFHVAKFLAMDKLSYYMRGLSELQTIIFGDKQQAIINRNNIKFDFEIS